MFYGIKNLNGKTLFYQSISQDQDRLSIYNKALSEGKISDFDMHVHGFWKSFFPSKINAIQICGLALFQRQTILS